MGYYAYLYTFFGKEFEDEKNRPYMYVLIITTWYRKPTRNKSKEFFSNSESFQRLIAQMNRHVSALSAPHIMRIICSI